MRIKPSEWAESLVRKQGPKKAAELAQFYAREFIGEKNDVVNPARAFYLEAKNLILKQFPDALKEKAA